MLNKNYAWMWSSFLQISLLLNKKSQNVMTSGLHNSMNHIQLHLSDQILLFISIDLFIIVLQKKFPLWRR